jgi:hypothetical protein
MSLGTKVHKVLKFSKDSCKHAEENPPQSNKNSASRLLSPTPHLYKMITRAKKKDYGKFF